VKKIDDYPMVMSPKDVQEILGLGRRVTYEMLIDPPFVVKRINGAGKYLIPRDSFFEWLNTKDN
jgi:hypothetical protein